ncbi:MAG: hypothetical protein Q4G27_06340, partial [Flavobacteriaceae bacterium]|nr:hypothetical protein [Flavobacteriaceae bacterium]
ANEQSECRRNGFVAIFFFEQIVYWRQKGFDFNRLPRQTDSFFFFISFKLRKTGLPRNDGVFWQ